MLLWVLVLLLLLVLVQWLLLVLVRWLLLVLLVLRWLLVLWRRLLLKAEGLLVLTLLLLACKDSLNIDHTAATAPTRSTIVKRRRRRWRPLLAGALRWPTLLAVQCWRWSYRLIDCEASGCCIHCQTLWSYRCSASQSRPVGRRQIWGWSGLQLLVCVLLWLVARG